MTALRAIGVDLTELRLAFEADTQDLPWFFDTQTGAVLLTTAEYDPAQHGGLTVAQIEGDSQRFLRVPPSTPDQLISDMREADGGTRCIFNLGHGIHKDTNPGVVAALCDEVAAHG